MTTMKPTETIQRPDDVDAGVDSKRTPRVPLPETVDYCEPVDDSGIYVLPDDSDDIQRALYQNFGCRHDQTPPDWQKQAVFALPSIASNIDLIAQYDPAYARELQAKACGASLGPMLDAGFLWDGHRIKADQASLTIAALRVQLVAAGKIAEVSWRTMANEDITISAKDFPDFVAQMLSFDQQCRRRVWDRKDAIRASNDV